MLYTRKDRKNTNASGASITTPLSGLAKMAAPNGVRYMPRLSAMTPPVADFTASAGSIVIACVNTKEATKPVSRIPPAM